MTVNELSHFGVLGMRWGRTKSPDAYNRLSPELKNKHRGTTLEKDAINSKDRRIKKGTAIQNISEHELDLTKRSRLYTSYTKFDNDAYIDLMGNWQYSGKGYKNTFVAKKSIKVPSDKKAVDIFLKTIKENPDEVIKDMTKAHNEVSILFPRFEFVMRKKVSEIDLNNPEGREAQKLAREFMTETVMSQRFNKAANRFYANVIKEGYDAISDPNDRDGGAQDPLIIVNMKAIKGSGSLKLTRKDLDHYFEYTTTKEHKSKERDLTVVQR